MKATVECMSCGEKLSVTRDKLGSLINCPSCEQQTYLVEGRDRTPQKKVETKDATYVNALSAWNSICVALGCLTILITVIGAFQVRAFGGMAIMYILVGGLSTAVLLFTVGTISHAMSLLLKRLQ